MRGSIRAFLGFMLCFGAVGGLDAGNAVLPCVAIAMAGLAVMASGVGAMNRI